MNVTVELVGTLVARAGTHRATVAVPEDATLADVIEKLAAEHGPQVRAAVLDGERIRADTVVVRERADETLHPASRVEPGETVTVQLNV